MKHLLSLTALFLAFLSFTSAQTIPNGDMEVWLDAPGAWSEIPEGWSTQNSQLFQAVYKEEAACEGEFAMKLTPLAGIESIMGTSTLEFPISAIPPTLDFCVKSNIDHGDFFNDTCRVIISFWNGDYQFYSEEWVNTTTILDWTEVSIPLDQLEPGMDACHIEVQASYPGIGLGSGSLNTWIAVDNFRFSGTNGLLKTEKVPLSMFPNPTTNGSFTLQSSQPLNAFVLLDLLGNVVLEQTGIHENKLVINTELPTGMYFLNWNGQTRKLIIE